MPSVISTLLKAQISLLNPILNALDLDRQRRLQDALAGLGSRAAANRTEMRDAPVESGQASWVFPLQGRISRALLYLHGGGYVSGTLEHARAFGGLLAVETGRAALCLGYRLAPEHPFPAALEDALAAYRLMLERFAPGDIAFAGESAGGGLCFALALKLKELGLPQPEKIVALSPWVDLSQSLEACRLMGRDPVLSCEGIGKAAELYLNGHDPKDPLASPLFGDLRGLPDTLIIAGGDEIIRPEDEALHAALARAGVRSRLHVEEGMWHVYPLYPVPEARQAQAMVRDFLDGRA